MKTITLQYAGRCADCGAALPVGARARWYGKGRCYCAGPHQGASAPRAATSHVRARFGAFAEAYDDAEERREPFGLTMSRLDPGGAYNAAGECIGRIACGCEDYPCCGH